MKHTILIRGIRDLTDARYYAAMGVDWLSMPLNADPKSFATWHAIAEWVQGPRFAVELEGNDEAVFAKAMIDLKPDGMIMHAGQSFPTYEGVQLFVHSRQPNTTQLPSGVNCIWHLDEAQVMLCARNTTSDNLLIETSWHVDLIQQLLDAGYRGGFCFSASGTEQVGVMDYSEMDDMLGIIIIK